MDTMVRNTRKYKMKENKKFPYKRYRGSVFVNYRDTYAIIDNEGNIIEKFRLKSTAIYRLGKLNRRSYNKGYKIVSLKD